MPDFRFFGVAATLSMLISSCAGVLDLDSQNPTSRGVVVPPAMIDGYGNPVVPEASQPQASTLPSSVVLWSAAEEDREWHGAVSRSDCDRLEKALRDKGLDVQLVDRQPTGDSNLPWACIFDGKDADPNADRFRDERSQGSNDSEYP
jgi:hypothetical protein